MSKKLVAILLCLFLLTTVIIGCKQEGTTTGGTTTKATTTKATTTTTESQGIQISKTGWPVVTEPLTFQGIMPDNGRKPYNENTYADWYEEVTGITIEMTVIASDVYQEKKQVLLAGGDYPDFFFMADMSQADLILYGRDSGILIDMKPLIDDGWGENMKKLYESDPDIYRISLIDGGLYSLGHIMNGLNEPLCVINQAWMDAVGMPDMPKNLDEFTELLRAFKNGDPNGNGEADEIPISSAGNVYWYNPIITCFGLATTGWLEDDNGTVFHAATTQNYKDYLTWSNMIYDEGLLDKRMPTGAINDEAIVADYQAGLIGWCYTAHTDWMPEWLALEMTGFIPFGYGGAATGVWPEGGKIVNGTFCITDKCEYPNAMLRWVDYLYTDEGENFMIIGKEGETFEMTADDKIKLYDPPEGFETYENWKDTWTIQGMHYFPGFYSHFMQDHNDSPRKQIYLDGRAALLPITKKAISQYSLTTEESEAVSVIAADLDTYIVSSEAKFISGEMDVDADWQTYQDTLVSMGLNTYRDVIQDAVDRFYGK